MFKVVEGLMPAIPSSAYFEPVPNKRRIRATRFSEFETTNIVTSHELILNNNKFMPLTQNVVILTFIEIHSL